MKLKDYQINVLDQLSAYLTRLSEKRIEAEEFVEFQKIKGRDAELGDYCRDAWESLSGQLPQVTRQDGTSFTPAYVSRMDGTGQAIPNICLKVPTGGC